MHLSDTELREHIRARLAQRENEVAAQRQRRGIRVIGRRKAEAVHDLALPKPEEDRAPPGRIAPPPRPEAAGAGFLAISANRRRL
jgi:hypothetical protein